jgi:general secretion pathway protein I
VWLSTTVKPIKCLPPPSCCRGLSLLEVLVAFSILALTLGVLLRIFGSGLRGAALAGAYSQAVLQAETLLSRSGIEASLEVGEQQGTLGNRYQWRRIIRPYRLPVTEEETELSLIPYEVIVEVLWQEAGKWRSVTLTSLRLARREQR